MKVIGYYTINTPYEEEYQEIKKCLDSYSINYHFYGIDNKGKWELNCGMKSTVLRRALDEHGDNILYLDVDARIMRQPPFEEIEKDTPGFCVWNPKWHPNELNSATMYFPNNDLSRRVLDCWIEEQKKQPMMWDQQVLEKIYKRFDHFLLHYDWFNILGKTGPDSRLLETENPIILQTQCSRRNKTKI